MTDSFDLDFQGAIRRAFPELSDDELDSAREAFLGYIDIVNDICDGLANDPERSVTATVLTAGLPQGTVEVGQVAPTTPQSSSLNA